jgi:hypothetical protein
MFNGPCIASYVSIITQQDAKTHSLFISENCSTCFGWYLHASSAAHITVSTVSGIIETVTATCRECEWMGTPVTKSSKVKDGERLCEIIVKKRYSIRIFFHDTTYSFGD